MLKRTVRTALVLLSALALASCATPATKLNVQWVNPQAVGKREVTSVMVMSVTRDTASRHLFEDRMVAALTARGIKAVPSYRFLPNDDRAEDAAFKKAVADAGVSYVMLTRVISTSQEVHYTPGYTIGPDYGLGWGGFYGYYSGMWASTYTVDPTIYTTQRTVSDTRIFDVRDGIAVWCAATTTSSGHRNVEAVIGQFVELLVASMEKDGLL